MMMMSLLLGHNSLRRREVLPLLRPLHSTRRRVSRQLVDKCRSPRGAEIRLIIRPEHGRIGSAPRTHTRSRLTTTKKSPSRSSRRWFAHSLNRLIRRGPVVVNGHRRSLARLSVLDPRYPQIASSLLLVAASPLRQSAFDFWAPVRPTDRPTNRPRLCIE